MIDLFAALESDCICAQVDLTNGRMISKEIVGRT